MFRRLPSAPVCRYDGTALAENENCENGTAAADMLAPGPYAPETANFTKFTIVGIERTLHELPAGYYSLCWAQEPVALAQGFFAVYTGNVSVSGPFPFAFTNCTLGHVCAPLVPGALLVLGENKLLASPPHLPPSSLPFLSSSR